MNVQLQCPKCAVPHFGPPYPLHPWPCGRKEPSPLWDLYMNFEDLVGEPLGEQPSNPWEVDQPNGWTGTLKDIRELDRWHSTQKLLLRYTCRSILRGCQNILRK